MRHSALVKDLTPLISPAVEDDSNSFRPVNCYAFTDFELIPFEFVFRNDHFYVLCSHKPVMYANNGTV